MTDLTAEAMRAALDAHFNPLNTRLDNIETRLNSIETRLDRIEVRVSGLPLIGEAIGTLQRDTRLLRAAVNDLGKTNITAGEVEAMHTDIDRALGELRELGARVLALEEKD
jgi:tetrahydromethanopterin S-methyltransferase subunit G